MKQSTLNLALIQFDPIWEENENNLIKLSKLLNELPEATDLVILPEAFSTGFSMNAANIAESMSGKTVQWMKDVAREKQIAICGSVFIEEEGFYYNRFIWIHPEGEIETYDKRHLFSLENEHEYYSEGNKQLIIQFKGFKIFPQVCYDLRFPVWSRNTFNYDLMINVANWPAVRRKVWKTLLKARAIENQCFVAAVNRVGVDNNSIQYSGDSIIVDYKGNVALDAKKYAGILLHQIDISSLNQFRNKFDTLKDADQFSIKD